jgi:hypothetical protein
MNYLSFIHSDTQSHCWLLPHDTPDATASLEVIRDGCGVVVTLSVDLPGSVDAATPQAALSALAGALTGLSAQMKGQ